MKEELNRVCPIIKNEHGQEVSTCPAIDGWLAQQLILKMQLGVMQ